MHNRPHTLEARRKMSVARQGKPTKWAGLPELQIVDRLLNTGATTRSIAAEIGCDASTIKILFRKHTTPEDRLRAKLRKQSQSLKGRPSKGNPNIGKVWIGRKHRAESREKQSKAKMGRPVPIAQRIAHSAALQGVALRDWTGFVTPKNKQIRRSIAYREWRQAIFARDDYTCQMCGKRGGEMHAHHIKTFAKHPDLRFDVANGVTLCERPCHESTKGKEKEFEHLWQ